MTVWAGGTVIQPDAINGGAGTGPFRTVPPNGAVHTWGPFVANYPIWTGNGSAGGTTAGQGGAVSVY